VALGLKGGGGCFNVIFFFFLLKLFDGKGIFMKPGFAGKNGFLVKNLTSGLL